MENARRSSTSHKKVLMLSIFWDCHDVILIDFTVNDVKLNTVYCSNLVKQARKKRRKIKLSDLYYLHDNAPIHTSALSATTIQDCGFKTLPHPPYSPDLAPSDFYLFNSLKQTLRGRHFITKKVLKTAVTESLSKKPVIFFNKAFYELAVRWQKCVDVNGDYFEK